MADRKSPSSHLLVPRQWFSLRSKSKHVTRHTKSFKTIQSFHRPYCSFSTPFLTSCYVLKNEDNITSLLQNISKLFCDKSFLQVVTKDVIYNDYLQHYLCLDAFLSITNIVFILKICCFANCFIEPFPPIRSRHYYPARSRPWFGYTELCQNSLQSSHRSRSFHMRVSLRLGKGGRNFFLRLTEWAYRRDIEHDHFSHPISAFPIALLSPNCIQNDAYWSPYLDLNTR